MMHLEQHVIHMQIAVQEQIRVHVDQVTMVLHQVQHVHHALLVTIKILPVMILLSQMFVYNVDQVTQHGVLVLFMQIVLFVLSVSMSI